MLLTPVMKTCRGCGLTQPRDEIHFYPHRYAPGKINWKCRRCNNAHSKRTVEKIKADPVRGPEFRAQRAKAERERAQRPEVRAKQRAACRRWYEKIRNDPERWQDFLVARRIERRLKRLDSGGKLRNSSVTTEPFMGSSKHDSVAADPFRMFLENAFPGMTAGEIVDVVGEAISERRLRGVLNGTQDTVALSTVDRFLTVGMDSPEILDDLYPLDA